MDEQTMLCIHFPLALYSRTRESVQANFSSEKAHAHVQDVSADTVARSWANAEVPSSCSNVTSSITTMKGMTHSRSHSLQDFVERYSRVLP